MKPLLRIYDAAVIAMAVLAGAMLSVIFLFVIQDVTLRNMLISPPPWTVPLTEYSLLYITMLAAPWLVRTRGHVLVEVLRQSLPPDPARRLEVVVYVICVTICAVLAGFAVDLWIEVYRTGEEDVRAIDIPRTILYAPLPIGFTMMGCEFLRFLLGPESLYYTAPDPDGKP